MHHVHDDAKYPAHANVSATAAPRGLCNAIRLKPAG